VIMLCQDSDEKSIEVRLFIIYEACKEHTA